MSDDSDETGANSEPQLGAHWPRVPIYALPCGVFPGVVEIRLSLRPGYGALAYRRQGQVEQTIYPVPAFPIGRLRIPPGTSLATHPATGELQLRLSDGTMVEAETAFHLAAAWPIGCYKLSFEPFSSLAPGPMTADGEGAGRPMRRGWAGRFVTAEDGADDRER
jgi:hypothetical protein